LREPLDFLRREEARAVAQRELQRVHDVIADDLGRFVVSDDGMQGFERAHGKTLGSKWAWHRLAVPLNG
jgi:hypothetical protein